MDEYAVPEGRLTAIFMEASRLHEQALAACLEEMGEQLDPSDERARFLVLRALMHAERAAACAADAANAAPDAGRATEARRALAVNRLAALGLRSLLRSATPS